MYLVPPPTDQGGPSAFLFSPTLPGPCLLTIQMEAHAREKFRKYGGCTAVTVVTVLLLQMLLYCCTATDVWRLFPNNSPVAQWWRRLDIVLRLIFFITCAGILSGENVLAHFYLGLESMIISLSSMANGNIKVRCVLASLFNSSCLDWKRGHLNT